MSGTATEAWLQRQGWITYVYGQTDEVRYHVHSKHSVQTQDCTCQSTVAMFKTVSAISPRFEGLKAKYKMQLVITQWGKA